VAESLTDDARMATPPLGAAENRETSPLVADSRVASPPRAVEAGEGVLLGTSECRPPQELLTWTPSAPDLVGLTTWSPRGPGTSGAQEPDSSSSSPRLPRREIDWNDTPWQDDIFEDSEDMRALRTSIVTINHALTVSLLMMYSLSMYLLKCH
jgi:hypothetical protein